MPLESYVASLSCKSCGLWIQAKDDRCPHCNRPNHSFANRRYHWKEHLLGALVEIVIGVLCIFVLGHFDQTRSSTTKGTAHVISLPANTLASGPPWPLVPWPYK